MSDPTVASAEAWFRDNWEASASLGEWWRRLAESGWGFPNWPKGAFGQGLDAGQARQVVAARNRFGAYAPPTGIATMMVARMLLACANDAQKALWLRAIAEGRDNWCQLFSEPGAGSDLAGVRTRADATDGGYRINGQKVWTSGAHYADWGILLARTDFSAPKHKGLSYFVIDMRQAGVDVRPLRQMNGAAEFNEVFLTDAFVPATNLIGALGAGWSIALQTLGFERDWLEIEGSGMMLALDLNAPAGDYASGAKSDGRERLAVPTGETARDLVLQGLRASPLRDDPHIRQRAARLLAKIETSQHVEAAGGAAGASIGKLAVSAISRDLALLAHDLIGEDALFDGAAASPLSLKLQSLLISTPAVSIAGGTDEIQRNIIAERVLGLPFEPRVDKDGPFDALARG